MLSGFEVGKQVVCIKEGPWIENGVPVVCGGPVKGQICTIATVRAFDEGVYINLKEFSPLHSYLADRFRPVKPASTDTGMAILRKLLDKSPKELVE